MIKFEYGWLFCLTTTAKLHRNAPLILHTADCLFQQNLDKGIALQTRSCPHGGWPIICTLRYLMMVLSSLKPHQLTSEVSVVSRADTDTETTRAVPLLAVAVLNQQVTLITGYGTALSTSRAAVGQVQTPANCTHRHYRNSLHPHPPTPNKHLMQYMLWKK